VSEPGRARRTGGRSARTVEAVTTQTLRLLAEVGYERLSISAVAQAAGVHETTIYRRWHTKGELVATAMLGLVERDLPIPDTGSLEGDLRSLMLAQIAILQDPRTGALVRALAGLEDADDEQRDLRRRFWATRADQFGAVVARAIARGELPPDTDPAELQEALAAPLYLRYLLSGGSLTAADAERVMHRALLGFIAR
jgi:AcrR family transcriptional regulator